MRLHELLTPETILVDWQPPTKWKAIEELTACLAETYRFTPAEAATVTEAVLDREHKMSTGMEHGIALPHATCDVVPSMTAALGVSPNGIEFESLDGNPTHIVVLLVYPNRELQDHIRMLAVIARLLSQTHVRQKLAESETAAEVLQILRQGEQQ